MRCPLALLASSIFSLALAQVPFERTDQRAHQVSFQGCVRADSLWVVAGDAYGGSNGSFISGFSAGGAQVWDIPFMGFLNGQPIAAISRAAVAAPGNATLVAGPYDGCDVLMPTSTLVKVDAAGNMLWQRDHLLEQAS
ncbi:MAG TPA: hypothetical protein PK760_05355, partial [Flavobacteriales bacterium]|nr:hypothetical protein [Flavobacteriales bacterium]